MAFWSASALPSLAQSESGGQASLVHYPNNVAWGGSSSSGSSASGLYGFLTGTWQTYAPQAGVNISQYPYAYTAPASVQTQVAAITPISNWTCAGCNSTASALANQSGNVLANPDASLSGGQLTNVSLNDPATTTTDQLGGGIDPVTGQPDWVIPDVNVGAGDVTGTSPTGTATGSGSSNPISALTGAAGMGNVTLNFGQQATQLLGNLVQAPISAAESAIGSWFSSVTNWFTRGFLLVFAAVIILVALWHVAGKPNPAVLMEAAA